MVDNKKARKPSSPIGIKIGVSIKDNGVKVTKNAKKKK